MKAKVQLLLFICLTTLNGQVDYTSQIQTIFTNNCTGCHMYGNASGGLTLTAYSSVMVGGNSGAVIVANDHANSLLWQKVNTGAMPQDNTALPQSQIDLIAQWIDEGALENPVFTGPVWHVATTGSDSTGNGTETNPFATIQTAIDSSSDGDTVLVAAGIYEGGIVISNKAISLIGESREGTKINQPISSPQISIVDCQAGTTRVENFIIKHGSSNNGGGIYSSGSTVEIDSVDFSYNSSSNNGAAINSIESTVKVQNSTFSLNTSDNLGGAIFVSPLTTCEIYNSSFDNNGALWGGAIATVGGGKLLVEGCNISFNTASGNNPNPNENYPTFGGGGGIYQEWSDSLEIYDSEITNNTAATGAGGGIAVYLSNDVTINNIVLSDNSSSGPNYPLQRYLQNPYLVWLRAKLQDNVALQP